MDYNSHQDRSNTGLNRYPVIFKYCYEYNSKPKNILSFGCSTGEEVETLAMFFGESDIHGVEINQVSLERCRLKFKYIDRIKTSSIIQDVKYDLVFCMSVFCKWPETKDLQDCSSLYNFTKFEKEVNNIHKYLNLNVLLVIYNSNFLFNETNISHKYKSIGNFEESGFVQKFNKENQRTTNDYTECIFVKQIE